MNDPINQTSVCCEKMMAYQTELSGRSFATGEGEISGTIYFDYLEISVNDGWGVYPSITFNFCPYCGKKQS